MAEKEWDEEDDEIVEEGAEYSPKSEFNKPKIVDDAVRKCIEARGKEMKEGYFNTTLSKEGEPIKAWIPDTRVMYIGTITALKLILTPEIRRSPKTKEIIKKQEAKIKDAFDRYCFKERKKVKIGDKCQWLFVKNGNQYIPAIDDIFEADDNTNINSIRTKEVKGLWNGKVNTYWWTMVTINDEIFAELNCLVDKLNYFKMGVQF